MVVAIDPAAGLIRLIIHGGWVNKPYNRCLFMAAFLLLRRSLAGCGP